MTWTVRLRGGAYDGFEGEVATEEPGPVMVMWACGPECGCGHADPDADAHASFDPYCPAVVLRTAEAYRRVSLDADERLAWYEPGADGPGGRVAERELVGVDAAAGLVGCL